MMPELTGANQQRPTLCSAAACRTIVMMSKWLDAARLAELYPAHLEILSERTASALQICGFDRLVIFAGRQRLAFRDDAPYPFIVNPYFKAWLPLVAHPDCALVITPGNKPQLIYTQPRDYWHMPPSDPAGYWVEHFAVTTIADASELAGALPAGLVNCAAIGADVTAPQRFGAVNHAGLLSQLDYQRAVKTPYEVACSAAANRRAAVGHRAARVAFVDGASEFAIHQAYCRATQHTDQELPYGNIVALNEHGAVLHYQLLDRQPPAELRSLLIDAGAACQGYAADITRTWTRTRDFAELIEAVDAMQLALCQQIKPGLDFVSLHDQAHRALAELLVTAGIAAGSPDALYGNGITRYFLPHGLGHLLGLQVHDVGGHLADPDGTSLPPPDHYPWLRLTRRLESNFLLTIEPGLYFIDLLLEQLAASPHAGQIHWRRVNQLKPFGGVRIEDNVVVEPTGHRNLTREAFAAGA